MIPNYVKGLKEFEHWQQIHAQSILSRFEQFEPKRFENSARQLACGLPAMAAVEPTGAGSDEGFGHSVTSDSVTWGTT
jgi:hypothetical protein